MSSSKSESQAERRVLIGKGLVPLTEREATQTVGGCGREPTPAPTAATLLRYEQA